MNGHGHVTPNEDGSRARCGGPAICLVCSKERATLWRQIGMAQQHLAEHAPQRPTTKKLAARLIYVHLPKLDCCECECGWEYDEDDPNTIHADHLAQVLDDAGLLRVTR
jgi:hypothetical protein